MLITAYDCLNSKLICVVLVLKRLPIFTIVIFGEYSVLILVETSKVCFHPRPHLAHHTQSVPLLVRQELSCLFPVTRVWYLLELLRIVYKTYTTGQLRIKTVFQNNNIQDSFHALLFISRVFIKSSKFNSWGVRNIQKST